MATRLKIPINQYSCSTTSAPACAGDLVRVHAECLGPERATVDGRPVDTMASHIEKNGDVGKRIVVTLDAGGAEWRSLAGAPEHVLNAIDQMAVVFHDVENPSFMDTARRLDEFFYVAHITRTAFACRPGYDPFRGPAFTALFVNKRIAVADPWVNARGPSPLDAPNAPACLIARRRRAAASYNGSAAGRSDAGGSRWSGCSATRSSDARQRVCARRSTASRYSPRYRC